MKILSATRNSQGISTVLQATEKCQLRDYLLCFSQMAETRFPLHFPGYELPYRVEMEPEDEALLATWKIEEGCREFKREGAKLWHRQYVRLPIQENDPLDGNYVLIINKKTHGVFASKKIENVSSI